MQLNMPATSLLPAVTAWRALAHRLPLPSLCRASWPSIPVRHHLDTVHRFNKYHTSTTCSAAAAAPSPSSPATSAVLPPPLMLYNTMTKTKETFTPRPDQGNTVSMYVCGVTVYDYSHIGHARVYVAFDVLYRVLRALQYDVTYVRNFTDIDDKIIARAATTNEDPLALSKRFIQEFHADVDTLGCLRPTTEPLATDYIPAMIESIQKIIDHGHGYAVGSDVFFDVESLPGYGALSGRNQEDNRAGERVAVDERKRGPADFALWKSAKPGEPTWNSPWGPGRPGWHIECSAMIQQLLGSTVDIHGGGRDLVFPHHENELAQARASAGPCSCGADHTQGEHHRGDGGDGSNENSNKENFARYWVHNGFVNVEAEKMSKSLGNFFTIRQVLQQYHPMALRWFLVNTQYRQGINYTQRALEEASDRVFYLYQTIADIEEALGGVENIDAAASTKEPGVKVLNEAYAALADDLNTPMTVAALSSPLKAVNDLLTTKKGKKQADRVHLLASYHGAMHGVLGMLGLWPEDPVAALTEMKTLALTRSGLTEAEVAAAIEERAVARAAKDFEAADAVRKRLEALGVMIMDTPKGTEWRPGPRLHIAEEDPRE
jgi:cysteinyl-tRNA synthetase